MQEYGLGSIGAGQGPVAAYCGCDNDTSGLIKGRKFVDELSDHKPASLETFFSIYLAKG